MQVSEIDELMDQARMLVARLERVSVDSIWARRSSGLRGALLRWVEDATLSGDARQLSQAELEKLAELVQSGFKILEKAARARFP